MRRWILWLMLVGLCVTTAQAETAQLEIPGMPDVWEQADQYGIREGTGLQEGLAQLWQRGREELEQLLQQSMATAAKLICVVLLCAAAEGMQQGKTAEGLRAVELAGTMAIAALTMTDMAGMIGLGRQTIGRMSVFSESLLPVLAVLTALGGAVTSAAVRQGTTVLFSQLLITAMDRLLVPMVYAYVAVLCACAALDNPGLARLGQMIKGAVTFLLTALLLGFVGYLTASGAIAGSVDASAVKAARMTISRAIPVVGSILADASETVLAGAGVLRGSIGAAGMLVVLAVCLVPFLRLALHYLLYKVTAALCAMVAQPRLCKLIDGIGGAFGVVLGMTGAGALILLVSIVSTISAGGM